jgi:hypothetical protein
MPLRKGPEKRGVFKNGFRNKHTGPVALAGQTGGAIRVVLDFFWFLFCIKAKKKRRKI